ncbi:hypothetical protein PVK06_027807 [Gossypium arboreum]|uniref:Uncharacterized protein n=1 Tax=Gossypium arboreum TaxID=29729 RepID=A0ABR0P1D4_GOSAR|nr:hypothetical protein PVK06_027807 [Gossypium arboreum]
MSTKHTVLSAPGTGFKSKFRIYWTRAWVAYGAHGTSYKFLGYMRGEIVIFLKYPRARTVTLSCELFLRFCPISLHKLSYGEDEGYRQSEFNPTRHENSHIRLW